MSLKDEMQSWDIWTLLIFVVIVLASGAGMVFLLAANIYLLVTIGDLVGPAGALTAWRQGRIPMGAGLGLSALAGLVLLAGVGVLMARLLGFGNRKRTRADYAASLTGKPKDIKPITAKAVEAKAKRLGVIPGAVGLPIGVTVRDGIALLSSFEDVCILIAGPRTGKTTSWVIPRIFAAIGAVVATSNKRDIVDDTRARRSQVGRVWVFDPQQIAEEERTWWWNPLSYVSDAVSAGALTDVFIDSTRDPKAQANAYFDKAARDLVAAMLLAAAKEHLPLTVLHTWLNNQSDRQPVQILEKHGEKMMAESLLGSMTLVPETRSGVYGSAATIMSFLLNEQAMKWVTPTPWLTEFKPDEFVRSIDTLYCLSQEGRGSASPIVTALTVAVTEAALAYAKGQTGGRLSRPMLIELDEAANVCRWRELPDLYSHFGSRGVQVDTILQSWSQGAQAWGEAGIKKLWSASNVKVYGGGVSERGFLSELSEMIGSYWKDSRSVSYSRQGRSASTSQASQRTEIASISALQALPAGRSWVLASGCTPVLTQMVPWWKADQKNKKKGNKK